MKEKDLKCKIQSSLQSFSEKAITESALDLFSILGYNTNRQDPFSEKTYKFFKELFLEENNIFSEEKAHIDEWLAIDLLFQLSIFLFRIQI